MFVFRCKSSPCREPGYSEDDAVYKYIRKLMALRSCFTARSTLYLPSPASWSTNEQNPFRTSSPTSDDSGLKARCSFQTTGASPSRPSEPKQRHRGMAHRSESSCEWAVQIISVLLDRALCQIENWSGSSGSGGSSTETCRRGYSTAGRNTRAKRRPPHSSWKPAHISTARLVGIE